MQLGPGILYAFAMILGAAAMNGAYGIPLRFMKKWNWENAWAAWTVVSMMLLPSLAAWLSIRGLVPAYSHTGLTSFAEMGAFGALWGIGVLMIGMSFPMVGVAIGNAIALGCAATLGSLLPLLGRQSGKLGTTAGNLILAGIAVMLGGVAICGAAGKERERRQGAAVSEKGKAKAGAIVAGIGGSLTSALNIAFAYGDPILDEVRLRNPGSAMVANALWVPILMAGALPGLLYCGWLMRKNRSVKTYWVAESAGYWPLVLCMAALWFGSVLLYGAGAVRIGSLGPVVGWPVFMSGAVIFSFAWSALAGEWKRSGGKAVGLMIIGISLLISALLLFGRAGS